MSQQPEALRLADAITAQVDNCGGDLAKLEQAAAELRRLHEENERLSNLCYDYIDQLTAIRAAEQMRKTIEAISKVYGGSHD